MTQRAAFSPATCAAGRIRLAHGLIKTIGSLRYRPAALDQPPILRRDGGRRRVRRRDVRGHVTRAGHAHVVRRGTRTADAQRARGPGASRRPRGTARGPAGKVARIYAADGFSSADSSVDTPGREPSSILAWRTH